jgi:hypothetical protein
MATVAEAVSESQRRLEQLAHGVRDRGKHERLDKPTFIRS